MIKSNSKKAKQNIFNYVKEYAEDYLSDDYGFTVTDDNLYSLIYSVFEDEARPHDGYNARKPVQDVFEAWASGLALGGLFCYYYNREAKKDLAKILEESAEEAAKYSEEAAEKMLTYLIYREVSKAARR